MLDKFTEFLDTKLSTSMARLAEQRHLRAVRDGIVASLPLIIVGSFFLILAFPPLPDSWGVTQYLKENAVTILLPYRMTFFIISVYSTFGIGYSLAKSYKLDGLTGGLLATATFLLTIVPTAIEGLTPELLKIVEKSPELLAWYNSIPQGWQMPMANLGGGSMFVAIVTSIIGVEIYRFTDKSKFKITMPEAVPASVTRSFEALTPAALIIILMAIVTYFLGFDWHGFIAKLVTPLVSATDTLPSVIILIFLITFFWSFGIHGVSIIGSLARPLWIQLLDANTASYVMGQAVPGIAAEPFFQWFIWIGGSGATIGLALLLAFRAKSAYGKSLGKATVIPAIFNINEPIIFGAPIVLNPILIIPFVVAPIVMATVSWFAMSANLVSRVVVTAPWTLPGPVGAYLATGGDWRASVLNLLCIAISIIIYYPFVKMYDKRLLHEEKVEEQEAY